MPRQPRRNAGARADREEVDAFQRDATEMVQVRPACEAVLHDHEPTGAELPLESLPDLMVECRPRAARDREGDEQRPIIRHAATSFASRSLSAGPTGASGRPTRPPQRPPPPAARGGLHTHGPPLATNSPGTL